MGIEKSALKVNVAESFTDDIKDRCEKSRQNIYRFQGAHKAFQESEEYLRKATQQIRDDFVAGNIEIDVSDPMNIGKFLVNVLMNVSKKIHDLSDGAIQSAMRSEGEVRGMELAVDGINNAVNPERMRLKAVADGIESGKLKVDENQLVDEEEDSTRPAPRPVGTHPGLSIKAKRQRKPKVEPKKSAPKKRVRKAAPKKKKKDAKNS